MSDHLLKKELLLGAVVAMQFFASCSDVVTERSAERKIRSGSAAKTATGKPDFPKTRKETAVLPPTQMYGEPTEWTAKTSDIWRMTAYTGDPANLAPSPEDRRFPWPPFRASAFAIVPRALLVPGTADPKLSDIAAALEEGFKRAGYREFTYHNGVPDGFAVALRIEKINSDGTPMTNTERWKLEVERLQIFTLHDYLRALFGRAAIGRYRVITFVVTPHPFQQQDILANWEQTRAWLGAGWMELPGEVKHRAFSVDYYCAALIYEFEKTARRVKLADPSGLQGDAHLEKSGLLPAFASRKASLPVR